MSIQFFFHRSSGDKSKAQLCLHTFLYRRSTSHLDRHIEVFQAFPFFSQSPFNGHLSARSFFSNNPGLLQEIFETNPLFSGERMIGWSDDDDLVLFKHFIVQRGMIHFGADQSKFNMPLQQLLNDLPGVGNLQGKGKAGMRSLKIAHQAGEKILPRNGTGAQRKFSSNALGEFAQGIEQVFSNHQDFRGISKKDFSCFCQPDFPTCSIEEAEGKGPFEREDVAAHRGLGKEEIIGGSGKTLQSSHPAKRFEMTKIDDEGLLLHHGSNLNTLSLKSKKK